MAIILSDVSKSFEGKQVLDHFSYRFDDGGLYLIRGASGVGKTTLLNIIMGLVQPDGGNVIADQRFSALFQQYRLLEYYDVLTNLRLVSQREDIPQMVEKLLGKGVLHQKICELSGGMKQRVCIIRALIAQSDVVIMDEPFNGLDEKNIDSVIRFIMDNLDGRTLIISTHQHEFLKQLKMNTIEL